MEVTINAPASIHVNLAKGVVAGRAPAGAATAATHAKAAAFVALKQHDPDQAEGKEKVDDKDDVLHEAYTIFTEFAVM